MPRLGLHNLPFISHCVVIEGNRSINRRNFNLLWNKIANPLSNLHERILSLFHIEVPEPFLNS